MKIPKLPQSPAGIVVQLDQIDRRLKVLSAEESSLAKKRTKYSRTRTANYAEYKHNKSVTVRAAIDTCEVNEEDVSEKLAIVSGEIQTLNLRKRYLERLAHKNGIVIVREKADKDEGEPTGGTFGA